MKHYISLSILLILSFNLSYATTKPKLVVNIVVGAMRYDYLSRFEANLNEDGFKRFMRDGAQFTESYYNYAQTTTPAALATLTTGTNPSVHGVVSNYWFDMISNRPVNLILDDTASGLDCDAGIGCYSPLNLTVPTLADKLKESSPNSAVVTIASNPYSAVSMGGATKNVFWLDESRGNWISSNAYMKNLPSWVTDYNSIKAANQYLDYKWNLLKHREKYINSEFSVVDFQTEKRFKKLLSLDFLKSKYISKEYPQIINTPAGNTLVKEFAKQAIIYESMGKDDNVDILNICFDTPRFISEMFGPSSMEVEDMFYRLDDDIADLINFIFSQMPTQDVLIVLTSDHGTSDAWDSSEKQRDRFNVDQFKVLVNGFMNAQFGAGDWVVDFVDKQLFINRSLIYANGLNLADVQDKVASFVLQFRGVAHVLTSSSMSGSYFGDGYAQKMQNSFYPRRGGDITINLIPGCILEDNTRRSLSGSMYGYDTHVPLLMLGNGIQPTKISVDVDMRDIAPTLARIMEIERPIASDGRPIDDIIKSYDNR